MYNLPNTPLAILDYLCDNGSLTYALAKHSLLWTVIGYDTPEKTNQCLLYYTKQYPNQLEPSNSNFTNDQQKIIQRHFDVVFYRDQKPELKSNLFIDVGEEYYGS